MKRLLIALMLFAATATTCLMFGKETKAMEEPAVVSTIPEGLRPILSYGSSVVLEKGTEIYFGGENLKYVNEWLKENVSDKATVHDYKLFQYGATKIWGFCYNGILNAIKVFDTSSPNLFNYGGPTWNNLNNLSYIKFTVSTVGSDNCAYLFRFGTSEDEENYEIVNLLLDCFYVATSEPQIVNISSNKFTGMNYSFNTQKKLIETGNTCSNIIEIEDKINEKVTCLYINTVFNLDEVFDGISCDDKTGFVLFDELFNYIGVKYVSPKNYDIKYVGNTVTVGSLYDTSDFIDLGAKYMMVKPSVKFVDPNGEYVETANVNKMAVHFVTTNFNKFFEDVELLEPDYSISKNVTWNNNLNLKDTKGLYSLKAGTDFNSNDLTKIFSSNGEISCYSISNSGKLAVGELRSCVLKSEYEQAGEVYNDFIVVNVKGADTVAPEIYGPNEYNVGTNSVINVNTIKNSLVVTDNYYQSSELELVLKNDYYSANAKIPGSYIVTFLASDPDGNYTEFVVKINVRDKDAPVFRNEYGQPINNITVHKSKDSVFLIKEVLNMITATDEVDGNLDIQVVKDGYSGNGDKKGNYVITLGAIDKSGNQSTFTINVYVTDSMPDKTLILDKRIIVVENSYKLSKEDVAKIMKVCSYYNNSTTSYIRVDDASYSANHDTNGEYVVGYNISSTNGNYSEGSFIVRVVESRTTDSIKNEKEGFVRTIFKWIWNLIKTFFEWILGIFK